MVNTLWPGLCGNDPLATVRLPHRKHLSSSDNLTSNNQKTEHVQTQTNINTKVALINNNTHTKTYTNTKDRVWFSHIYNIQSGNEAGQFLQPRSPHGFRLAIECTQYAVVFIRIHPSVFQETN